MAEKKQASLCKKDENFLDALAKDAAHGKEESFSLLVAHFKPVLGAMVASLPVPAAEKEDLMQEGFIGLYKAVRLFDPSLSSFATFARLCMRSAVLDGVRKYQKTGENTELAELEDTLPADSNHSPERILMGKEELRLLLQRVDRDLSPMERRIFGLHVQGKSLAEISSLLGKDRKSVENTLYRLRKKLSSSV